ncbi:acyltransferase [Vibrio cholerae]|nr:acyltransferase [Vibrio cholerae]
MVAIYHLHVVGAISHMDLVKNSYLFVEFFFVLSGFVICYSYENKIKNIGDLKIFMKKRFARLWPLHIFMTFLFIPFALANIILNIDLGDRFSFVSFISNFFLVQALNINDGTTWNIPAWSISVEFYTYFIFGFFAFVLCGVEKTKYLIYFIISFIAFIVLFNYSSMGDTSRLAIFRCIYSFFLGVIAFKIHKKINIKSWMEFIMAIILLSILCFLAIKPDDLMAFFMPLIFFITIVIFSHEKGFLSKLLLNRYLERLGVLSFSIYLTHSWFISSIKAVSKITEKIFDYQFMYMIDGSRTIDFGIGHFNDLLYVPYIIVIIMASSLTYKYIERPWQKRINDTSFTLKQVSKHSAS